MNLVQNAEALGFLATAIGQMFSNHKFVVAGDKLTHFIDGARAVEVTASTAGKYLEAFHSRMAAEIAAMVATAPAPASAPAPAPTLPPTGTDPAAVKIP